MQQTTSYNQLFKQIKQLSPTEQFQLAQTILTTLFQQAHIITTSPPAPMQRTLNLHPGAMIMHEGFDDELPDEFWLGKGETDEILA